MKLILVVYAPLSILNTALKGVLSRCVTSSLLLSHEVRRDVDLNVFVGDVRINFDAEEMRNIRPDEQSLLGVVSKAIRVANTTGAKVFKGVRAKKEDLATFLADIKCAEKIFYDAEFGRSVEPGDVTGVECAFFAIKDLDKFKRELVESNFKPVRFGKHKLHADQAIVLFNNFRDRGGRDWRSRVKHLKC